MSRERYDDEYNGYESEDIEKGSSEDIYRRRAAERRARRSPNAASSRRRKKVHPLRICINIAAVLIILASAALLVWHIGFWDTKITPEADVEEKQYEPIQASADSDVEYILVCGFDESNERTDVNMLVCWDKKENTANILQIPRDTYMGDGVYHSNDDKFNATYERPRDGESKPKAVCRKINSSLGLPVDHYVMFSIKAFRDVVDTLGGVEVDVERVMSYRGVTVYPGTQVLDGDHAEVFMRYRHGYNLGDTSRVKMQRKFYAGLAEKAKNMSLPQLIAVLDEIKDELVTDMTYGELKSTVSKASKLDMKNVRFFGLPGESYDFYSNPSAKKGWISYYTIHLDEYVDIANKYFNPGGNTIYAEDLEIKQMSAVDQSIFHNDGDGSDLTDYKESIKDKYQESSTSDASATTAAQ